MSPIPINLAVEDQLSDAVARRLLQHASRYAVGTTYGREGFGYLRKTISGWNKAAKGVPFMVMTDLDDYPCPRALIDEWLGESKHPNLLLRVAVREVESWLLADILNLPQYLKVSRKYVPENPDTLTDAKASLVALAKRSHSSEIRAQIVPRTGSTAKQGPEYNSSLSRFVWSSWDIESAGSTSPSLARTVKVLTKFVPNWEGRA
jgi:hypothetical protein